MNLGQQIIAGIRWTGGASLILMVGYFVVYGVLFHLVLPEEFAVFSLAQGVAGLALNVMAPALGYAIVAKETLSVSQFSAVFWLNLLLGLLLSVLIWFSADWLAHFYGHDRLSTSLQLICLVLPIASVGASFRYLLQREAKFQDLSVVKLITFFAFALVAIWGTKKGNGALALVIAFIAQTTVESIYLSIKGGKLMRPIHFFYFNEWQYFLRFGLFQGLERFVDTMLSNADTFLIGKLLGMEALGVFEAAKRILIRPLNLAGDAIETVLFPIMSKRQNEAQRLRTLFLENVKFLGMVCFMPYLVIAILSAPLTTLLLGSHWQEVGQVFGLYALVMLFRIPRMPTDALLMSKGKPEWWLVWKLVVLLLSVTLILVLAKAGLLMLLIGLIILQIILTILNQHFLTQKLIPVKWKKFWQTISAGLAPAMVAAIVAYLVSGLFNEEISQVIAGGFSAGCVYLGWIMNVNKSDFMTILQLFKMRP